MEFEDIVDMDWLNSNTTTDESILSSTASPSLEKNSTVIGAAQQTEAAPQSQPVVAPMPDMVMPSTEHIKQLIEIAKQHLALREQQQQQEHQQNRRASSVSLAGAAADEAMTLEAYAVSDGIDIKKLTPKERRQLRNKISARNFRVRRKEYISTLEAQVDDHKKHAEQLKSRLDNVEDENKQLRLEVDTLRRQNQLLQQQQQKNPSLNKDISMLGSKASETYRHDTRILVSNAVMPVWDFDQIFTSQQDKSSTSMITTRCSQQQQQQPLAPPEQVLQYAGYILTMFVQLHRASEDVSLSSLNNRHIIELEDDGEDEQQVNKIDVPLLPDDRDFTSESDAWEKPTAVAPTFASPAYMEYLYDTLIMSALTTNTHTDKSFWWWDTPMFHQ
ncbi:hypothetical protein BDC45DRAFT_436547 [Circinella umbellata]|nr:hypothetical protein BDC45DRAFT_436547 [Circinella umbellata]